MQLVVPEPQERKLKGLEKSERERIRRKLDEIQRKISELGADPEQAVEKRLTGRLHPLLQQRVGDWRLWFDEDGEWLVLIAIKHKEDAETYY